MTFFTFVCVYVRLMLNCDVGNCILCPLQNSHVMTDVLMRDTCQNKKWAVQPTFKSALHLIKTLLESIVWVYTLTSRPGLRASNPKGSLLHPAPPPVNFCELRNKISTNILNRLCSLLLQMCPSLPLAKSCWEILILDLCSDIFNVQNEDTCSQLETMLLVTLAIT